jgi:hypothetical protein
MSHWIPGDDPTRYDPERYTPIDSPDGTKSIRSLGFEVDEPRWSIHMDVKGFQFAGLVFALAGQIVVGDPEFAAKVLTRMTARYGDEPMTDEDAEQHLREQMPNLERYIRGVIEGINETLAEFLAAEFAEQIEEFSEKGGDSDV